MIVSNACLTVPAPFMLMTVTPALLACQPSFACHGPLAAFLHACNYTVPNVALEAFAVKVFVQILHSYIS